MRQSLKEAGGCCWHAGWVSMPHCLPHLSGFICAYHPWPCHLLPLLVLPPPSQFTPSIVPWWVPPCMLADDQGASTHSNWWHCSHAQRTYAHSCLLAYMLIYIYIYTRRMWASAGTINQKHTDTHQMAEMLFGVAYSVHLICTLNSWIIDWLKQNTKCIKSTEHSLVQTS